MILLPDHQIDRLRCPVCHQSLSLSQSGLVCESGHQFDRARQGYFHLLMVQRMKSRQPGDNQAMVDARQAFLASGYYQPLLEALSDDVAVHMDEGGLLDVGCGEGWYTRQLKQAVPKLDVYGLDISKLAVRKAAGSDKQVTWLVASAADMPVADQAMAGAVVIFSFLPVAELKRVLQPEGWLWVVSPAPDHLLELRQALFDEQIKDYSDSSVQQLQEGFVLEQETRVRFTFAPDVAGLSNLLAMTPFGWRAKPERQQALLDGWQSGVLTADFWLRRWRLSGMA